MEWSRKGPAAWLGLKTRVDQGRLKVGSVVAGGPAERAGVYANDELLALDGFRTDDEKLKARLGERPAGETVVLTLFRGDRLIQTPIILTEAPCDTLRLLPRADATEPQQRLRQAWLGQASARPPA